MEYPLHIVLLHMEFSLDMDMLASDSLPTFSKHRTIILVEDQPDLRWLLKRRLEINGYTCLEAENGMEALALIQQPPSICLILSDYLMPGMNGLQLLQALRLDFINRAIPFMLVTATWSDQLRHQALSEGAFAVLSKPYHHDDLLQLLGQEISTQAA